MSTDAHYTPFHPKWYRSPVSLWWWLKTRAYTVFVLRELTSVFVAFYALTLLWLLRALLEGPEAYALATLRLRTPLFLTLDVVALLFVLFHTITWFNAAPAAMVVRVRGRRIPNWVVTGSNYALWVLISIVVAGILLRG